MATGKTNARWLKVLVDDSGGTARDISGDVTNIQQFGLRHEETDVTGYSDAVINFTLGHPEAPIVMSGTFNNTATTGSHVVLSGIVGLQSALTTVTIQVGIKAAAAGGNPEFEGEYYCSEYVLSGDNGITWSARFVPGSTTAPAWGTV